MITSSPSWAFAEIAADTPLPEPESSSISYSSQTSSAHSLLEGRNFTMIPYSSPITLHTSILHNRFPSHTLSNPPSVKLCTITKLVTPLPTTAAVVLPIKQFLPPLAKAPLQPMSLFAQTPVRHPISSHRISAATQFTVSSRPLSERCHLHISQKQTATCQHVALKSQQHLVYATNWLQQKQQDSDQHSQHQHEEPNDTVSITDLKTQHHFTHTNSITEERPVLEPPRIGVFALYYILTKIGIVSDAQSNWEARQHIQANQEETEIVHKARLEEMQKALDKEQETKRWSVSVKVFSWLTSFMSLIAGIVMIITGVGAVAGALLVAGGVFTLTNQVLEVTGGWEKIAGILPGDNPEKKRAVIMWMQIGISVLCLILAGAGVLLGGYSAVGEAMNQFMAVFGGIVLLGQGVSSIGQGVTLYLHKENTAETRRYARRLVELKYRREDLMEKVEASLDRMKQLFEEMTRALDFSSELFYSDQMVNQR
ncbi:MAG: type III secretion system translocon subunit SctE [Verrucomicrobia bacterium]|nr:type III secretion system translocon subunit SctE [Verrucomicrobiota bacterium]MBS0646877.1 type III secretion system translocon subunit SctE [Verrucomicrobiota bacterium]